MFEFFGMCLYVLYNKNLMQIVDVVCLAGAANGVLGLIVPEELKVQFESIGISCQEKYNCTFGNGVGATASITACMNPTCSQNRYPSPNIDDVWNLTRWIEKDAMHEELLVYVTD